jgi:hypothetical protein
MWPQPTRAIKTAARDIPSLPPQTEVHDILAWVLKKSRREPPNYDVLSRRRSILTVAAPRDLIHGRNKIERYKLMAKKN